MATGKSRGVLNSPYMTQSVQLIAAQSGWMGLALFPARFSCYLENVGRIHANGRNGCHYSQNADVFVVHGNAPLDLFFNVFWGMHPAIRIRHGILLGIIGHESKKKLVVIGCREIIL